MGKKKAQQRAQQASFEQFDQALAGIETNAETIADVFNKTSTAGNLVEKLAKAIGPDNTHGTAFYNRLFAADKLQEKIVGDNYAVVRDSGAAQELFERYPYLKGAFKQADNDAILKQFDRDLGAIKTIADVFDRLVAIDDLTLKLVNEVHSVRSSFGKLDAAQNLREQIMRDNYDTIKNSAAAQAFFAKFPHQKNMFDGITLQRANERPATPAVKTASGIAGSWPLS